MKKWLSFLLVLMLLACTGLASAEGMDLSSLSDDELMALHLRVHDEIVARRISATAKLPSGAYIAGKDLPAGSYIFTARVTGEDWGNVTIYSEQGEGDQLAVENRKSARRGSGSRCLLHHAGAGRSIGIRCAVQLNCVYRPHF